MGRVGMREVAQAAGLSTSTVSNYLNASHKVSPKTAERIQAAIDSLRYVRNNAGRQLRMGKSWTIAYIVPDLSNPFFAAVANGVEQRAIEHGFSVFLANSLGSEQRENDYLERFEEYGVSGLLIASRGPVEDRLAQLRSRGTQNVLVGRKALAPDQPSISVDNISGGYIAVEHLLSLGRKRIAFIGGPIGMPQVADRFDGASRAIRDLGEGASLEFVDVMPHVFEVGQRVGTELTARSPSQRPDAVFAVNDRLAIGIEQQLLAHGVKVPDDIAIVGFDDILYAETSPVPITSVRPPQEELGSAAADLLLPMLEPDYTPPVDGHAPHVLFSPKLEVRASTVS